MASLPQQTLLLPFSKEESVIEAESIVAGAAKQASDSSSNSSRSDSNKSKRPPTAAELKEVINVQAEAAKNEMKDQGLF